MPPSAHHAADERTTPRLPLIPSPPDCGAGPEAGWHWDATLASSVMRRAGKTFNFATRFFPAAMRGDIALLYAFCRTADDIADGAGSERHRLTRLDRFQQAFLDDYQAGRGGPAELFHRHAIPVSLALDLLAGMRSDLAPAQYRDFFDLRLYCYRVASTVGLMLCHVWGVRDPAAQRRAEALGVAMQLTNIARDVGEDFRRGRVYLPLEWRDAYGLAESHLAAPTPPAALAATVEHALQVAESHYREGLAGVPALPQYARFPVELAAVLYRDIHRSIRYNGYDVLHRRAATSLLRKVWLAGRLLLR